MKKTFLTICILFVVIISNAQIKKGSLSIGADFSLLGSKQTSTASNSVISKSSSGLVFVNAGKAVKDNFFVGVGLGYTGSYSKNENSLSEQNFKGFVGNVWTRKYYSVYKSLYCFINGSVGFQTNNREYKTPATIVQKQSGYLLNAVVYPGLSYRIGKNFFLDASINNLLSLEYSNDKTENFNNLGVNTILKNQSYSIRSSIGTNSNPLQVGLRWIIGK